MNAPKFRRALLDWYRINRRDLPWRRTPDPWRVLVSEVMLQQTRVEAVIPYYARFLDHYPDAAAFARASEPEVLRAWAGLGYYSRARNLHKSACEIARQPRFPSTYDAIRSLPGVGDYTAAAVASIAFNLPYAALDGNIARVLARITNDSGDIKHPKTRARLQSAASKLLHPRHPGEFNQALMELGATVCVPRNPKCLVCPVAAACEARARGRERELPVRSGNGAKTEVDQTLLLIVRAGKILLTQRGPSSRRLPGFWELPDLATLEQATLGEIVGRFRHSIVNTQFNITVRAASISRCRRHHHYWWPLDRLHEIPLSTAAKKAVPCLTRRTSHT